MTKIRILASEHKEESGVHIIETDNLCAAFSGEDAQGKYVQIRLLGSVSQKLHTDDPEAILKKLET